MDADHLAGDDLDVVSRAPSRSFGSKISVSLHSSAAGAPATRGALTSTARRRLQPGIAELADAARRVDRAGVHLRRQLPADQVDDELAAVARECDAVLLAARGEPHQKRMRRERVEERIGRQVDLACAIPGRDPADRPRRHDRLERIVRQAVAVLRLVEQALNPPTGRDSRKRPRRHRPSAVPARCPQMCRYGRSRRRAHAAPARGCACPPPYRSTSW